MEGQYGSCCGLVELADIGDELEAGSFDDIITEAQSCEAAFYTFTLNHLQEGALENVTAFIRRIRKLGLGTVTAMPVTRNPGSGNMLHMWVWAANHDALEAWTPA